MNRIDPRKLKPLTPVDLSVALVLVVICVLSVVLSYRRTGATVVITAPGLTASFPLDTDRRIELEHLTVVIENGQVYVADADCPDKVCQHTGKISRENQTIVCLPNRVTITITGEGLINGSTG